MSTLPETAAASWSTRAATNPFLWVCALLAAAVASLWPALPGLARIWQHGAEYGHGSAIVAIVVVWLVALRGRIATAEIGARPLALPALAALLLLWLIAHRANSELMQQVLMPPIILVAILAALGPGVARVVLLPIGYLYFAIPIWDHLIPALQAITTFVAQSVLGALGVPVSIEGFHVTIPAGRFTIAEGCSGKRYLIVALALAVAAGAMQRLRWPRFAALIAVTVLSALVINWIRVIVIIYAGHVTQMQHYLVATEHFSFGYALFVPLLIAIVLAARRIGSSNPPPARAEPSAATVHSAPIGGLAGSVALLAATAIVGASNGAGADARPVLEALPILTGQWQGPLPAQDGWSPEFAGAVEERRAAYATDTARIEIYVNLYGRQAQGAELINDRNSVAPAAAAWSVVRWLPGSWQSPASFIAEDVAKRRWVIAYIYASGERVTSSAALTQLHYGARALWGPAPAGLIALAAPCATDCDLAAAHVSQFWNDHGRELAQIIPREL
jgi:EpsI family protein